MRTASLWGKPPSRYYRYLRLLAQEFGPRPRLAVLGCSDGKFVLPAARRGFRVLAIDVDRTALFGGQKVGPQGYVVMNGLKQRVRQEGVEKRVTVVEEDMFQYKPRRAFDGVFTSGAVQYSRNREYDPEVLVRSIVGYLRRRGLLYIDYMLPLTEEHAVRANYIASGRWPLYLRRYGVEVVYNRVLQPLVERGHVDNPTDHLHHWGHLLARKI